MNTWKHAFLIWQVCAGQESNTGLEAPLREAGLPAYCIGGAHVAAELDAKRAIDQVCHT
jgi:2,4-dienoyl-CoA reductase (NADPH2)